MNHATTLPCPTTVPVPYAPSAPPAAPTPRALWCQRQPAPPPQAVQALNFRRGETALLEVEHGRVWVTCDGRKEDYVLDAGQRLSFPGPVCLRVSALGGPARLCWARSFIEWN